MGFTLIEMLAVLAILSILVAAGATGARSMLASARVAGLENEFVAALNLARSEAVRRGREVRISAVTATSATNEWGPGLAVWIDTDSDGARTAADTVLREGQAAASSGRIDSTANVSVLRFTSAGFVAGFVADSGSTTVSTFRICDGTSGRLVSLRATGQVASQSTSCG